MDPTDALIAELTGDASHAASSSIRRGPGRPPGSRHTARPEHQPSSQSSSATTNREGGTKRTRDATGTAPTAAGQLRRWCFTVQDEMDNTFHLRNCLVQVPAAVRYYVMQMEKSPSTGRPHMQGFIEFMMPMRFAAVKAIFATVGGLGCTAGCTSPCTASVFSNNVHIEEMRKTPEACVTYCTKEKNEDGTDARWPGESPITYGSRADPSGNGKWAELVALLHANVSLHDIEFGQEYALYRGLVCRNYKALCELEQRLCIHNMSYKADRYIEVIIGPPGSGKSSEAYRRYGNMTHRVVHRVTAAMKEWVGEGYTGQPVLLIEDVNDGESMSMMSAALMIEILDPYVLQVQAKGKMVWLRHRHVIITSNNEVEEWWGWRKCKDAIPPRHCMHCSDTQMEAIKSRVGYGIPGAIKRMAALMDHRTANRGEPVAPTEPDYIYPFAALEHV